MSNTLMPTPLTRSAFASFGDVIEIAGAEVRSINAGTTRRFHNLATLDTDEAGGRPLLSIFHGQPFRFPMQITMLERHPLGSQAFVPMNGCAFLVIVARDENGTPAAPAAFVARGGQGVNYARNTWHHPLLSLSGQGEFIVIDREGAGQNLEEFFLPNPLTVLEPAWSW